LPGGSFHGQRHEAGLVLSPECFKRLVVDPKKRLACSIPIIFKGLSLLPHQEPEKIVAVGGKFVYKTQFTTRAKG
jgi:hypothetical protein